jgi:lipoate-protein ligase A
MALMHLLDLTLPTLAENLALDEALLSTAEEDHGGEVLRFWQWQKYAVVLGASGIIAADVHLDACQSENVPIARRSSGGGTVLLGPGCMLFTLVLDQSRAVELQQITSSYRWILGRVADALSPVQDRIELAGTSDLAVLGRKLSGNAQQRKRRYILHHGTLLHRFDLQRISRFLKLPPRRPEYRGERDHTEFLTNLPDRPDAIREYLRICFDARVPLVHWPEEAVAKLVEEKYERPEWNRRR